MVLPFGGYPGWGCGYGDQSPADLGGLLLDGLGEAAVSARLTSRWHVPLLPCSDIRFLVLHTYPDGIKAYGH